ncbi:SulP family inorganic anion transporter [Thiolapillus sp.]
MQRNWINSLRFLFPFLHWWPLVTRDTVKKDFLAGLTGAIIVLPQGIAFATIAGLPPEYGLYTAMVTPIIAALFGSSRHLISGPTTAISIVVFSSISRYAEPGSPEFIQMALTLTFLAGAYQLGFGLARLGTLVNFVSHTVVVGFTAGAAILIATSQVKHVLGVEIPRGESFAHTWLDIFHQLGDINWYVLAIAGGTLATAIVLKKISPRLPHLLLALIAGSLIALVLGAQQHGVALVPAIPAQLPPLSSPDFSLAAIQQLAPEAFAIALLGLIEAVSISRAIATKSHQRIDSNQEFIGQGLSNMVGSFFSSYAGSGSFTRSGVNYASGAVTPLSAIFSAVFLMLIVLLVAPLTAYIPVAAMGGVILLVAWNLIEFKQMKVLVRASRAETGILVVTFLATLFLELEFAIYIGVLLSLVIFLNRTSHPDIVTLAPDRDDPKGKFIDIETKPLPQCPQLRIIRIDMSIYFGSVNHIENKLAKISEEQGIHHILLVLSGANFIDVAGAEMLVNEARALRKKGGNLYFCGMKGKVWQFMAQGGFIREIGAAQFFETKPEAVAGIYKRLDKNRCETCMTRIFRECLEPEEKPEKKGAKKKP